MGGGGAGGIAPLDGGERSVSLPCRLPPPPPPGEADRKKMLIQVGKSMKTPFGIAGHFKFMRLL
jgi:hypothetical protein